LLLIESYSNLASLSGYSIADLSDGLVVAIDGKTLRGAKSHGKKSPNNQLFRDLIRLNKLQIVLLHQLKTTFDKLGHFFSCKEVLREFR